MTTAPFSASGSSFSIHERHGSGPAILHVHHSDDEAWHVPEGQLTFRYTDRIEIAEAGSTVVRACRGAAYFTAGDGARYLIVLTPAERAHCGFTG